MNKKEFSENLCLSRKFKDSGGHVKMLERVGAQFQIRLNLCHLEIL